MQDWLPAGWLAFAGRESNPLDCCERFSAILHSFPLSKAYPDASRVRERRKFYEAAKLHPADTVATRIVASINELFAIDARPSAQKLDHTARHQLRQQEATPLLESVRSQIKALFTAPCRPAQ